MICGQHVDKNGGKRYKRQKLKEQDTNVTKLRIAVTPFERHMQRRLDHNGVVKRNVEKQGEMTVHSIYRMNSES